MLFLFDIDGTLVRRMPPFHGTAMCEAVETVYGVSVAREQMGPTAGRTDTAIALHMLAAAGVDEATATAGLPAFYEAAADAYDRLVVEDLRAYRTPHAEESLLWLRKAGAVLGLVTGNIERIAWRKLGGAGLAEYFLCGGFGNASASRNALPPIALARAEQHTGRTFARSATYVVGDTPLDVACGAANGLRTVAVATGPVHSLAELRACGAEYAFDDLRGLYGLELATESGVPRP